MQTLIYMIRHGESVGNQRRDFLGHTDLPITEKGERLDFDTMKDFAKNFSGTPRGLREALKKGDGKTFVFKGHHFWLV